jgi:NADH dehydrogenase [ubiquinone] 1 alpha subcomplex assembly factor 7
MSDFVRAARVLPAFGQNLQLHLVEASPVLREAQRRALAPSGLPVFWHETVATLPSGPLLVVANEFFDALPIHQFQRTTEGWAERLVAAAEEESGFRLVLERGGSLTERLIPPALRTVELGAVVEVCPAARAITQELGERVAREGGAMLIIDYGYEGPQAGDSFQAVRDHQPVSPLCYPGQADLTAHVDFAALAEAARRGGAATTGPISQGAFLQALGIVQRAEHLGRRAGPLQRTALESGLRRLIDPAEMGALFKVLAVVPPSVERVAGFPALPFCFSSNPGSVREFAS